MAVTKVPSIPNPAQDPAGAIRALKEIAEVREGHRGDPLDAFVTYRNLTDYIVEDPTVVSYLGLGHDHITPIASNRVLGRGSAGAGDSEEMVLSTDNGLTFTYAAASLKINTPQSVATGASPEFVTAKLTNLTDDYIPYHVNDATGLANGPTKTNVDSAVSLKHAAVTVSAPISLSTQAISLVNDAVSPATVTAIAIDGTFASNSDTLIPTQKAAKTYADTKTTLAAVKADADVASAISLKHAEAHTLNSHIAADGTVDFNLQQANDLVVKTVANEVALPITDIAIGELCWATGELSLHICTVAT
jgi:hypothetical protein